MNHARSRPNSIFAILLRWNRRNGQNFRKLNVKPINAEADFRLVVVVNVRSSDRTARSCVVSTIREEQNGLRFLLLHHGEQREIVHFPDADALAEGRARDDEEIDVEDAIERVDVEGMLRVKVADQLGRSLLFQLDAFGLL